LLGREGPILCEDHPECFDAWGSNRGPMKNSRERRCSAISPTNAAALLGVLKPPGGVELSQKKHAWIWDPFFLFGPQQTNQRGLQGPTRVTQSVPKVGARS